MPKEARARTSAPHLTSAMLEPKSPTALKKLVKESPIDAMGTPQRYAVAARQTFGSRSSVRAGEPPEGAREAVAVEDPLGLLDAARSPGGVQAVAVPVARERAQRAQPDPLAVSLLVRPDEPHGRSSVADVL